MLAGSSTWWRCSSCSECVSMQPGAELKPRVSVPVWAVTPKNRCPNLEVDPLLITGTVRRAQQVSHRRERRTNCSRKVLYLIYFFVSGLFVVGTTSALIPACRSRTTSEPFRTSTATTLTSAWRCDTACATGTWRCSGGCITTSTLTPPSGPTLWGEASPVQVSLLALTNSVWWSCISTGCGQLHEVAQWIQVSMSLFLPLSFFYHIFIKNVNTLERHSNDE